MPADDQLELGRQAHARRAWGEAHASLSSADRAGGLGADDLALLATSAYMLGRDDEYVTALERAHQAHLAAGDILPAARSAIWLCIHCSLRGEAAGATGWLGRAQRLLERVEPDCVERGYVLIPLVLQSVESGDHEAAYALTGRTVEIGERFGDADLLALGLHEHGHALVRLGRLEEGLRVLDEAMVAVVAEELSPIVTGLVYCNVIAFCRSVYELRRAREWTVALSEWCAAQPDMVAHTALCSVHRAEIMELGGAWGDALEEARRVADRSARGMVNQRAIAEAHYRRGEVHRLRGELTLAEAAYRDAIRLGREPQPGLALLRLSQGDDRAAAAAIRRVLGENADPMERARLLPAFVECMLAFGDLDAARAACDELERISAAHPNPVLRAISADARGAVNLTEGDARDALVALRRAMLVWQELEAPYEVARTRVRVGLACRALDDADTADLEFEAARTAFADLGAAPDLARLDSITGAPTRTHGLTQRELEVLRLVAAGGTNKSIAAELVLSDRTVDRHVSNILAKLRVRSRSAATAYAYEHQLL